MAPRSPRANDGARAHGREKGIALTLLGTILIQVSLADETCWLIQILQEDQNER